VRSQFKIALQLKNLLNVDPNFYHDLYGLKNNNNKKLFHGFQSYECITLIKIKNKNPMSASEATPVSAAPTQTSSY
jgi:hypothetical protein